MKFDGYEFISASYSIVKISAEPISTKKGATKHILPHFLYCFTIFLRTLSNFLKKCSGQLYCLSLMIASKHALVSSLLFALFLLARSHTIESNPRLDLSSGLPSGRVLQALAVANPQAAASISKIISDSNTARKEKGRPPLSVNSSLQQIIKQWAVSIKGRMSLSQYMQLYAIHSSQAYTFASVPLEYILQVVKRASPALTSPDYSSVGTFNKLVDGKNYDIIIVLQGGYDSLQTDFSREAVLSIIKEIESEKAQAEIKLINQATAASTNHTRNASIIDINSTVEDTLKTNSSLQSSSLISVKDEKSTVKVPVQNIITEDLKPKEVKPTSDSQQNETTITPKQQNQKPQQPQQSQQPKGSQLQKEPQQPQQPQQTPQKTQQAQPKPQEPQKPQQPPQQQQQKNTSQTAIQQTADQNKPQNPLPLPNTPPIQTTPIVNDSPPAKLAPNIQASPKTSRDPSPPPLPLNNSSFKNIILTHNIPTTFVKNQVFPFKGYITVPNPSGIKVNVIFIRVTDQRRLSFNSNLPPNATDFEVLAGLTLSGNYYISIFVGLQGSTSVTQYTVIPSFFGKVNTKSPAPLSDVGLTLKGNDLWLDWSSKEAAPAITQLIFSQQSGVSLQFLLSNYKTSFQIPYAQFTEFSSGITSVSIAQAFSATESAAARTSEYSAPYSIIFNATTHHFAKFTGEKAFQPVPFRIQAGGSVSVKGVVPAGGAQNELILLSPSKRFLSYYIDGNKKNKVVAAGVAVSLTIPLNQTGVYILEVNNAGGEALINTPLYVGDIYPLLPDFMDLAPTSLDFVALSEPFDLDSRRSIVSVLINTVRAQFGAGILYLDNNLNALAQSYSSAMIQQQFLSHTDKQGNSPSMRAKAAGIKEKVGENLAVNSNLTQAQLMLQRSPAHLRNMVDAAWTRVGLGIVQNSNQVYYLTQEFSSRDMAIYPLTSSELAALQRSILSYIQSKFPYLKTEDKQLSDDLSNYQKANARSDVVAYLSGVGHRRIGVDEIQLNYNAGGFIVDLAEQDYFQPSQKYSKIGVSAVYKDGNILILAAYS